MPVETRPRCTAPSTSPRRGRLGGTAAFRISACTLGLAMFSSGVPSPLYGLFQDKWGFSTFMLTLVFAVYCGGVLVSLLLFGRWSDELGRRPLLIAALCGLIVAALLFAVAPSVWWLVAARTLQGLSNGVAVAAASAALLDFEPSGDAERAGYVNGVVGGVGIASGVLVAALLAEHGPVPTVTPFLVLLVLFAVALALVALMPESVARRERPLLRPERPHVPPAMRGVFLLASLGVLAAWSVMGVVLALGPRLAQAVFDSSNLVVDATLLFVIVLAGTVVLPFVRRVEVHRAATRGSLLLGAGALATAASLSLDAPALVLAAGALVGVGFGIAFLGSMRSLSRAVPDEHRAEVMAALFVVAYASNSIPVLGAGLAVRAVGLTTAVSVLAVAAALVAFAVALLSRRMAAASPAGEPRAQESVASPL